MRRAVLSVRTQRQQRRFRRILDAGRDARNERVSGLDGGDAQAWILAIGTGQQPAHGMSDRKEGCQLNGNGVRTIVQAYRAGERVVCANTSHATGSIVRAATRTPIADGLSLISASVANHAGKEKDRCANTGLLRKGQLDVTFGIRSDNRQTA